MKRHLPFSMYDLKDSLWYRPGLMTLSALVLSLITLRLDIYLFTTRQVEVPWLFEGGSEGARGVLMTIAGTTMTVSTTAFSITLVALQLASSQYSPRILRNFTGDVGNQLVLGIFIATFAFSLSVLRTIRSASAEERGFVPTVSVSVALGFALLSIGSLIYFFHHATRTIQASVVIDRTYTDTSDLLEEQAAWLSAPGQRLLQERLCLDESFRPLEKVYAERAGYLQDSNPEELIKLAVKQDMLVQLHLQVGNYLNKGTHLATIWRQASANTPDQEEAQSVSEALQGCLEVGMERTLERDSMFGMQQLTDIALLALSPGTNDPTTALSVIDNVSTAIIEAAAVAGAEVACADDDGRVRLIHPVPRFKDYLRTPFDQIRHYGVATPHVAMHVLQTLAVIASEVQPTLVNEVKQIALEYEEAAEMQDWIPADIQRMREAAAWAHVAG